MANEIFTRIQLKYDSWENWDKVKATFKPLKGELCVVDPGTDLTGATATPCLLKVGDGTHFWKDLPWVSAPAADVFAWAKQATLALTFEANTETSGDKTYTGNAITNVVWDNTLNDGKGGLKFVKGTQFATRAELDAALEAFGGDLDAITDNDTRYVFEIKNGALEITRTLYVNGAAGETETKTYDFVTPEELEAALPVIAESDRNGYIKVDDEDLLVYDEIFGVDMATVNALGGIAAGTNLKDKTIHEVLNALLFPYVKPTVGTPARVPNTTAALEKGNNQTITQVSATVTKKSAAITKVELLKGSEVIATKEGADLPNITTSGTTVTFSGLNIAVPSSSVTLKIRVTDAEGSTVTSGDTAGWTFVYPYYYGICAGTKTAATLTEADIEAMTKDIKGKGEKSYKYENMDAQKMVIAYPKAHGVLKKALDPNNFDYIDAYDRAELSITGLDGTAQTYYVYAQKEPTYGTTTMKYQY